MDVLIVGAGIVGLSTAYWLTKRGCNVTVIERGTVPCALASSCDHHRLIRYFYGDAEGYCARMRKGYDAWYAMWDDLPGDPSRYYADTGMLAVSQQAGDYTDRSRVTMEKLGLPFERIDSTAELDRRFPFLQTANLAYGLLAKGGALMANRILLDLAEWLRGHGANILEHSPVASVDTGAPAVTLADGRVLYADRVVVCAGVETRRLMPDIAVPMQPTRSLIVYADPPEDLRAAWQGAPCWTDLGGETELWGMAPVEGLPLKLGNGAMGSEDQEDGNRTITADEATRLVDSYSARFRGVERFRVRWAQANYWTMTPEGRFALVEQDAALMVCACAGHGFKFGALSGRDVSEAVSGDVPVAEVARRMAAR